MLQFRFELTPPFAKRWTALTLSQRNDLMVEFAQCDQSMYSGDFGSKRTDLVVCSLTPAHDVSYDARTRRKFAQFVTHRLNANSFLHGEVAMTKQWAESSGAPFQLEVPCAVGRIDVLYDGLIVEAKYAGEWKHALGQVLAYKACLQTDSQCALLLLGKRIDQQYQLIERCCMYVGVHVLWHDGSAASLAKAPESVKSLLSLSKRTTEEHYDNDTDRTAD